MKTSLCILLFLLSVSIYAQPGDVIGWKTNRLKEINSLLQIDTNNHQLLWERLEIVYNPHFDIYTKTRESKPITDTLMILDEPRYEGLYKNNNILKDLNYLIDKASTIKTGVHYKEITKANFYYKRGQYYYLNGQPKKALEDFLIAVHANADEYLINRISISIAAYYYNLDSNFNLQNFEKALEYIDITIPEAKENTSEKFEYFSDANHHPFEREKIMLLELTGKDERLKNYLKSLAKSHLYLYTKEIEKSDEYKNGHTYTIPASLDAGLDYLFEIAKHYYEKEEYEKSEKVLDSIINYLPSNEKHFKKEATKYQKYYSLLSEIYTKDCCKNTQKRIETILEAISNPLYAVELDKKLTTNVNQSLKIYPTEPKLLLSKAILIFKEKKEILNIQAQQSIDSLLINAEKLNLNDYRIPYLRGLIYKNQTKYYEAIKELDKAIAIYDGNPQCYWEKYYILKKIPNYDEAKINAIKAKAVSLSKKDSNPFPISENISQLIKSIDEL